MKIIELRQLLEEKKVEARGLIESDIAKAEQVRDEIKEIRNKIAMLEELEEEEKRDLMNQKDRKEERNIDKVSETRAFAKYMMGESLSAEERAVIKSSDVGTVIPKQFIKKLEEVRQGYSPLKGLCDVIPVSKPQGSMPVIDLEQNEMKDLTEGDDIVDGSLVTTDLEFKVNSIGLIEKFSFESVEDAEFSLEELATKNFGEISVRKENKRILNVIDEGATVSTSKKSQLHQKLVDEMAGVVPAAQAGLITLVNTAAYQELKNKEDSNGRNLNLITVINGKEYFNNKPIYRIDDALVTLTESKTMLAYMGNLKEAVKFFDRKQVTIARAEKFESGAKMVRVLERIDVKAGTKRSLRKIEL